MLSDVFLAARRCRSIQPGSYPSLSPSTAAGNIGHPGEFMQQTLRAYQVKGVDGIHAARAAGHKRILFVLPTGGGKTSVAAHLIHEATAKAWSTFFLAHREELINQCSKRLDDQGVPHGIIKAGNRRVNSSPVQVASVQTLVNRIRPKEDAPPNLLDVGYKCDLMIIDEAHRALASTYLECVNAFPDGMVLGLTATPVRSDGRGLGDLFNAIVTCSSPSELTEMGFLVPSRVFTTPLEPDLSKVKVKMGEYDKRQLEEVMNNAKLVGDVYTQWKLHGGDRQTVIFSSSRAHGQEILRVFQEKGENFRYLDGDTPSEERAAMLADLEAYRIRGVINMGVLTEGWDCPPVSCVQIVRPTKSLALYLQMAGRGLRPLPGEDGWSRERWGKRKKQNCILIDHGGNTMRHGLVTEDREWTLEGEKVKERSNLKKCFKCGAVHDKHKCPECGHVNKKPKPVLSPEEAQYVQDIAQAVEADLEEVDLEKILARRNGEIDFFKKCLAEQIDRGYRPGYAKKMFMQKFGRWPGKEIGLCPIWGANYSGGPPQGYRFGGVEYLDRDQAAEPAARRR